MFLQKPGIAKKDTSRLFLASTDGGLYDSLFTADTMPEQVIAAYRTMEAVERERKRREAEALADGAQIPSWIPHSDHFMAGLLFAQAFNERRTTDPTICSSLQTGCRREVTRNSRRRYKQIMGIVNRVVKAAEKQYGYSHPRFFKTQPEYDNKLKPKVTEDPT